MRKLLAQCVGPARLIHFGTYGELAGATRAPRRTVIRALAELHRAGYVTLDRPSRRARQSVQAARLALRLPQFAHCARDLGALGSAQRLDEYAARLAVAPNPGALRMIAAALAQDAARAEVSAREDPSFAALCALWRSAADLAAYPRRLDRHRRRGLVPDRQQSGEP